MEMWSILTAVILLSAYLDGSHANGNKCEDQRVIGKVLSVASVPAEEDFVPGDAIDIMVRLQTPFKARGAWYVGQDMIDGSIDVFAVPEKDTGSIRARTKSEGLDTYAFSLHLDSLDSDLTVSLSLDLNHPCNYILIHAVLSVWRQMTGITLPTALNIPKPIVDLRDKMEESMEVGLMVDRDEMELSTWHRYFRSARKGYKLLDRTGGSSSKDPVQIVISPSKSGDGRPSDKHDKREGTVVFTKQPKNLAGIQTMVLQLSSQQQITRNNSYRLRSLSVGARTQILLTKVPPRPAVALAAYQYQNNLLQTERYVVHKFYDTDGTRLLPIIDHPNSKVPFVFDCTAEQVGRTPFIIVAAITSDRNGFDHATVLNPLTEGRFPGIAFNAYEVPALTVGEKADFICTAGDGADVTNLSFRIVKTKEVVTSTKTNSQIVLDEDTFKNGFNFTCRTDGDPSADVHFYKEGQDAMGVKPYVSRVLESSLSELQSTDRLNIVSNGDGASLVISPGTNPFPAEGGAFRLICLGRNQFTGSLAYADFVGPSFGQT